MGGVIIYHSALQFYPLVPLLDGGTPQICCYPLTDRSGTKDFAAISPPYGRGSCSH